MRIARTAINCLLVGITTALHIASAQERVTIQGGTFTMGAEQGAGEQDEQPAHTIQVSTFTIDKNEITMAQYDSCATARHCTPAHYDDGRCVMWTPGGFRNVLVPQAYRDPQFPAICVSWSQAQQYCRSKGGRLPTEAQWEYAARAGGISLYAWGDDPPGPQYCVDPSVNHASKVSMFSPNAWGLYDMTGNVWEWTSDYYDCEYYSISPSVDPQGPEAGLYRVIRGGGWYSGPRQMRLTNRHWFSPDFSEVSIGFRCVY